MFIIKFLVNEVRKVHFVKAKGILSAKNGINVYRGCLHGCIYCDSRSDCYNMQHDFEDIEVKENAPELLEKALRAKRRRCVIGTGAMCDPYIPIEKDLRITRRCLEITDKYNFGAAVLTKSDLVMRDIDLLAQINEKAKAVVQMTLTTADDELCRIVEPNVCVTSKRVEVLCEMKKRGIPTVVWLTPLLPFINDTVENLAALLEKIAEAGVYGIVSFGMGLTLRSGDREYFYAALDRHFPGLREKYSKRYGNSYEIPSPNSDKLWRYFTEFCDKYGIVRNQNEVFSFMKTIDEPEQITLL